MFQEPIVAMELLKIDSRFHIFEPQGVPSDTLILHHWNTLYFIAKLFTFRLGIGYSSAILWKKLKLPFQIFLIVIFPL